MPPDSRPNKILVNAVPWYVRIETHGTLTITNTWHGSCGRPVFLSRDNSYYAHLFCFQNHEARIGILRTRDGKVENAFAIIGGWGDE